MTIYCDGCKSIPERYSDYKGYNYCFPCLYRISHKLLEDWKRLFPVFNIHKELKIIENSQEVKT